MTGVDDTLRERADARLPPIERSADARTARHAGRRGSSRPTPSWPTSSRDAAARARRAGRRSRAPRRSLAAAVDRRRRAARSAARCADDLAPRAHSSTATARAGSGDGDPTPAALRRWKRRELLRIAVRDLLGDRRPARGRRASWRRWRRCASRRALAIVAAPSVPIAVIGMGKLGGRELNYASDVDVLFVHEGDGRRRRARRARGAGDDDRHRPRRHRVPHRRRPPARGPAGAAAAARSTSYEAYWDEWARTWEFQALIKARPVAGDADLGARFMERGDPARVARAARPRRDPRDPGDEGARRGDAPSARASASASSSAGRGGIRDIEFAVQLLQLVHGRARPVVRSPTTLDALDELADGGYVDRADADRLDARLPVPPHRRAPPPARTTSSRRTLFPSDAQAPDAARPGARLPRHGPSAPPSSSSRPSTAPPGARSARIHEKLFFAPLLDTLAGAGPLSPEAAEERLAAFGFPDVERTRGRAARARPPGSPAARG